ncbi:MAG: hypothetical protein AAF632_14055 [Bacteroidota bacterium]
MKQPITRSRHKAGKSPTENQQNFALYYWELHRCLNQDPEYRHRILLRAMKETDELRKKIRRLYNEHAN